MSKVKTISLPVQMRYPGHMVHFKEELDKRRDAMDQALTEREQELADLLSDGYELVTSHVMEGSNANEIVLILYKDGDS